MRDSPHLLVIVGCEETIVGSCTDLDDGAGNAFPKTAFVTDLFEERG